MKRLFLEPALFQQVLRLLAGYSPFRLAEMKDHEGDQAKHDHPEGQEGSEEGAARSCQTSATSYSCRPVPWFAASGDGK